MDAQTSNFNQQAKGQWRRFCAWLTREEHKQKAREVRDQVEKAFTDHPHETGETYVEHLWFTLKLTARLLYASTVLLIHGLFPFLLTRAASNELERVYAIIKARVPKHRREIIDTDWSL